MTNGDNKNPQGGGKNPLVPYMTPLMAFGLSFGFAVGWGAFIVTGSSFLPGAGPLGALIAIGLGGIAMVVFALNYYRLCLRFPGPGGAFAYTKRVFGDDHGFLVGWFLFLTYIAILWANATSVKLMVRYVFGDVLQFGFHYVIAGFDVYMGEVLLTSAVVVAMGVLCFAGKRFIAALQAVMAFVFIACVACVFAGMASGHKGGLATMAPLFAEGRNGVFAVCSVLAMMPWAFVGFEAVTNSAGEFKFAIKRKLLYVMLAAIVIGVFMYGALTLLPVFARPERFATWAEYIAARPNLDGLEALPTFCAAKIALGRLGLAAMVAAMVCGQLTGVVASYVATSRLMYAMSRSSMLPEWFGRLDRNVAPRNSILFVMGLSVAVAFFGRAVIAWPIDNSGIGAAFAYGYTSFAAFKVNTEGGLGKIFAERAMGLAGLAMAGFFAFLLLVPNYLSGTTLSAESYLMLAVWSIAGFIYYKHIFRVNPTGDVGQSMVVWVSYIILTIFSSLMWVRQATHNAAREILVSVTKPISVMVDIDANMAVFDSMLRRNSFVELAFMIISIVIMIGVYSILRKREQDMAVAKSQQEQINKAKSYFFSTVSHDIRTPLNAIIGFSQMLKEGFKTREEHDQAIDSILLSGKTLLQLINDVLDLSKLESGKMHINPEPTDCRALLVDIADSFRIANKGSVLDIRSNIDAMPVLMLDPQRMRQIVFNLMGNAVKFTKTGFVEVRASFLHTPGHDEGIFRLDVEDSGCGISDEDLKKIATPYVQVGDKAARHGGTGLGLAITRQLAAAMGGEMVVASELGKGTTFSIIVPGVKTGELEVAQTRKDLAPEAAASAAPAAKPSGPVKPRHILIADDQKMNLMVLKAMLPKVGPFDIATAANGREALQILEASTDDNPFDVVLTDMWMPEMDGEALVRTIRRNRRFAELPVYVITADVESRGTYAEAGFTGMLLKPVTLEGLVGILG